MSIALSANFYLSDNMHKDIVVIFHILVSHPAIPEPFLMLFMLELIQITIAVGR